MSDNDWANKLVDAFIDKFAGGIVELGKNRSRYGSTRALADEFRRVGDLAGKVLLAAEWTEHGGPVYTCTGCQHGWTFKKVHTPDCRVDAALTKLGYPDRASRDKALRELRQADFDDRWKPKPVVRDPAWVPDPPTSDPDFDSDPDDCIERF